MSVGACGRIGYDGLSDSDAAAGVGVDGAVNGSVDAAVSGVCGTVVGGGCSSTNVVFSIGGSTTLGGEVLTNEVQLAPTCGASNGGEYRIRFVAPGQRVRVTFAAEASFDVLLSLYAEDCDGAVVSCTSVASGSGTEVLLDMEPGEAVVTSVAAVNGCGSVSIQASAIAL